MSKVTYLGHFGNDLMVVNCARESTDKWYDTWDVERDARLVKYLARNEHWTPFAHPQIQFRIRAPIYVARQFFRSTVGTVRSEMSRRYVSSLPRVSWITLWRARPVASIKQGSGSVMCGRNARLASLVELAATKFALYSYAALLKLGVAPEQARTVLPQNMETEWIETGSLQYWSRFCNLRSNPHAQAEIRAYAGEISKIVATLFPCSWPALTAESRRDAS